MVRNRVLTLALLACSILIFTPPPAQTSDDSNNGYSQQPDIVLFLLDDLRWDQLKGLPAVSALQSDGVTFSNAFVSNPLCCPSRASLLTGGRSWRHGVWTNVPPHGGWSAFDETDTIATRLHSNGYRTALVGKYFNLYRPSAGPTPALEAPPGWDHFTGIRGLTARYTDYDLITDDSLNFFGSDDPKNYSTDVLARDAESFIDGAPADSPLFLYFAPIAPHMPFEPAKRHANVVVPHRMLPPRSAAFNEADVTDKPAYVQQRRLLSDSDIAQVTKSERHQYRTLLAADEALARIREALVHRGTAKNTVFVLMSDNGYLWGEHRLTDLKDAPYEDSIRVPLVIATPSERLDSTRSALVTGEDVAATLAAAGGVKPVYDDGRSLLTLLADENFEPRRYVPLEHVEYDASPVPTYCGVRTTRLKLIVYATGERELYDLIRDPAELVNRYEDPAFHDARNSAWSVLLTFCDHPPPGLEPLARTPDG